MTRSGYGAACRAARLSILAVVLALGACSQSGVLPKDDGVAPTGGLAAPTSPAATRSRITIARRDRNSGQQDLYAGRDLGAAEEPAVRSAKESARPTSDAPANAAPLDAARVVRVFYATSRKLDSAEVAPYFGASRGDDLTRGFADVSLPPDHRLGAIERPALWRYLLGEDERRDVVIKAIYTADAGYYGEVLSEHATSADRRALVFVHGFATSFTQALQRTAQLKYDLAFKGPVILFSWPSHASLAAYPADAANADWSEPMLANFIADIARTEAVREVTVIAFSMGAKVTTAALAHANPDAQKALAGKLQNIVLAAPDIDKDVFVRDLLPKLSTGGRRITVYASQKDRALEISRGFHNVQRLGSMKPTPAVVRGLDTIDASTVDTSIAGHAYYGDNRSVVSDLYYLINEKLPPSRRATLRQAGTGQATYWAFAH